MKLKYKNLTLYIIYETFCIKISVVVNYLTNFLFYKLFSVNHYKILLTYNAQLHWKLYQINQQLEVKTIKSH